MSSAPHVSRAAVGIACLGVAVGVGVSVAAQAARRQTKSSAAEVDHPLRQWSEKQVSEWLVRIGVSEQTVKVFRGEVINGSGLLDLSEQDIVLLSANAKDAEAILNALRCCPKGGELEAFLNDTQAMFVSLATERPKSSEELSRQLFRVLYAFKSFQLLPKEAQVSALLPMSRQVASALKLQPVESVRDTDECDTADGRSDGPKVPLSDEASVAHLLLRLRELFSAVKSGSALALSPDERIKRVSGMLRELQSIQQAASTHSESEQRTMIFSVSKTVGDLLRQMLELAKQENELRAGGVEMDKEGDEEDQSSGDNDIAEEGGIGPIVADLSKVFQFLTSSQFDSIPLSKRGAVVSMIVSDVDALKTRAESCDDAGKEEVLRELVVPLQELLASMQVPAPESASESFANVHGLLEDITSLIESPEFQQSTDVAVRQRVVEAVRGQLVRISETFDSLTDEERAVAEEMILPINAALKRATEGAEAGDANNDVATRIMGNIELVMQQIQQPDFLTIAADERARAIHGALITLSTSRDDAVSLGVSGNPLVVFIDELVGRLKVLSEHESDEDAEADDQSPEESSESIISFIHTLKKIHERVPLCRTKSELMPLMQMVERVITASDRCDVPWRDNAEAVAEVSGFLQDIQQFQAEHADDDDEVSAKERAETALAAIRENPPQSMEELLPFYNVLCSVCSGGVEEGIESVAALQSCIREAAERLQSSAADAGEEHLASNLMVMSNALRDEQLPESVLQEFESTLNQLSEHPLNPKLTRAIEIIRGQIEIQREALKDDEEEVSGSDNGEAVEDAEASIEADLQGEDSSKEPAKVDRHENVATKEEDTVVKDGGSPSAVKESMTENVVEDPSVLERDLSLFPRIEAHLALPPEKFATTCTPFDLSFIKLVLKRLSSSPSITDEALKARIRVTQERLAKQLGESGELETKPDTTQASLRVLATEKEMSNGSKGVNFLIRTESEAEEKPMDRQLMTELNDSAQVSEQPTKEDRSKWDGQSLAILLNDPENTKEERRSIGNELSVLDDALTQNGFDVVHASPSLQSRGSFEKMLRDAMKSNPSRLFVYNSSGKDSKTPELLKFEDGSSMSLGDVLNITEPAERTVVATCHPNRLDMNYRHDNHTGPSVAVELTPEAAAGLQSQRCAIFDGIFTPIVAQFLGNQRDQTMCPEDLMRWVVSTTSSSPCISGMRGGKAGQMGYFR